MAEISNNPGRFGLAWPATASADVKQVRKAITNRDGSQRVDSEVAPLLAELLAQSEVGEGALAPTLTPPRAPLAGRPAPATALRATRDVCAKLRHELQPRQGVDYFEEQDRRRLAAMLDVLHEHVALRDDVISRVRGSRA